MSQPSDSSTSSRGSRLPPASRWALLVVGVGLVLIMGGQLWLSYVHPYPFGVTLHQATIVSKEKHTFSSTTNNHGGDTAWELAVKLDDGSGTKNISTGLHDLNGKDVGDHVQVYQGKASSTWHVRDYHSTIARLGYLAGLAVGVLLLVAWGFLGGGRRRARPSP